MDACLYQLAGVDDVRTFRISRATKKVAQKFLDKVLTSLNDEPRRDHILENIKKLEQMFDPKQARKAA